LFFSHGNIIQLPSCLVTSVLFASRRCDAITARNLLPWNVYSPTRKDVDVLQVSFHPLGKTHFPCQGDTIVPWVYLHPSTSTNCSLDHPPSHQGDMIVLQNYLTFPRLLTIFIEKPIFPKH
jgi:hypothetical protein